MRLTTLFGLTIVAFLVCPAYAQSILLENWRTTSGAESAGAFYTFDADTGIVTLLVPKPVPMDRLDDQSRKRALEIVAAQESDEPAEIDDSDPGQPLSLAKTTIEEWLHAGRDQRVEYCANFIYFLITHGMASASFKADVSDVRNLNRVAGDMEKTIAGFYELLKEHKGKEFSKTANELVTELFMLIARDNKWLGRDASGILMADDVMVKGLKVRADGKSFDIVGELFNLRKRKMQVATISLAFYDDEQSILGTASTTVVNLAADRSQPIDIRLYDPGFTPNLANVRLFVLNLSETD